MSEKKCLLFVGLLEKSQWDQNRIRQVFNTLAAPNNDHSIIHLRMKSYTKIALKEKFFVFLTFSDPICVDRCIKQREEICKEYGIMVKRLLPTSISKCDRLIKSADLIISPDRPGGSWFTIDNIRSYFCQYGEILDIRLLKDTDNVELYFIRFSDWDSTDQILIDAPHRFNEQILFVHKFAPSAEVCNFSQFNPSNYQRTIRYPHLHTFRKNLESFIDSLSILHRVELALMRDDSEKLVASEQNRLTQMEQEVEEYRSRIKQIQQKIHEQNQIRQDFNQPVPLVDTQINHTKSMTSTDDIKQKRLHVCPFPESSWTHQELRQSLENITGPNSIVDIKFYPAVRHSIENHVFAIVTFQSNISVDQCLANRAELFARYALHIKRDLHELPRNQRQMCHQLKINLQHADRQLTKAMVDEYFSGFGSITDLQILIEGQEYLLQFDDYDSVDQILLKQPHFFNGKNVIMEKCFSSKLSDRKANSYKSVDSPINGSIEEIDKLSKEQQSKLGQIEHEYQEKIDSLKAIQRETINAYDSLKLKINDLQQKVNESQRIQTDLREKLNNTQKEKQRIIERFEFTA